LNYLSLICALILFLIAIRIDCKYIRLNSWTALLPGIFVTIILSRSPSRWLSIGREKISLEDFAVAIELGNPIDQIVYGLIFVLGIFVLIRRRSILNEILSENKMWMFLFGYCLISLLWSDHFFISLKRFLKDFCALIMVLVVATEDDPFETFKAIIRRNIYLLIPLSVVFCKYFPDIGRYQTASWQFIYTGVTTHKNLLGKLCMIALMVLVADIANIVKNKLYSERADLAKIYILYIVIGIYLMTFANSMTSNICLVFGLIVFFSKFLKKHLAKILVVFSICYIIGILEMTFNLFADFFLTAVGKDLTLSGRTQLWEAILDIKINPMIGVGYNAFWLGDRLEKLIQRFIFLPKQAHNGYLEIYINLGIIGLMFLLFAIYRSYRKLMKSFSESDPIFSFNISFFITYLVYNLTEATFLFNLSSLWFVFLFVVFFKAQIEGDSQNLNNAVISETGS
jgi:exopolysaccharide production protein ExoQ